MMGENAKKFHTIRYAGDEFFEVNTSSGHKITVDVKGGRKAAPGPLELFIAGLAACTAADVVSILEKKRESVTEYWLEVRTERREEHPRSFTRIELSHFVRGNHVSPESVARAIDLSTNKYCSAVSTVRPTAEVVTKYQVLEANQAPHIAP